MSTPDLDNLVIAARRAAAKLKAEYDSMGDPTPPEESWAEGEALWDALRPFEHVNPEQSDSDRMAARAATVAALLDPYLGPDTIGVICVGDSIELVHANGNLLMLWPETHNGESWIEHDGERTTDDPHTLIRKWFGVTRPPTPAKT